MVCQVVGCEQIVGVPGSIDDAYTTELNWKQGHRLNLDCRLVLLGIARLLRGLESEAGAKPTDFGTIGLVAGSNFSSLLSYEIFHDSVLAKSASPVVCAQALPSTPVTAASICFGFLGATISLSGGNEVGITAFRQAATMLRSSRCSLAIAGCWHVASHTTDREGLPNKTQLSLLALRRAKQDREPASAAEMTWHVEDSDDRRTCVDVFNGWLTSNVERLQKADSLFC
jgi:hypothetical protein